MWLTDSIKDFFKKADLVLLGLILAASFYGMAVIYSATRYRGTERYVLVQLLAIALGVVAYMVVSFVDIELLTERSWKWLLAFNILFILVLLTPLGVDSNGNRSWLQFPGMMLQPAEIVKISFILLLSKQFSKLQEYGLNHFSALLQVGGHTIFMCALIAFVSSDMGMVLVYLFIFLIIAWTAGVQLRWFVLGGIAGLGGGFLIWPYLGDHIHRRIEILFDHTLDPLGQGFQQSRSILSIGSGGVWGQGFLQGTQSQSSGGLLPAQWTDFIFSVAGEELGMVGCIAIIAIIVAIILRCVWVARRARSAQSALIAIAFAGMLMVQTVLNIGMCLYVLPVVGLTLPFFSSGGSSIITLFASMGIVSSIKMRSLPSWLKDRSNL